MLSLAIPFYFNFLLGFVWCADTNSIRSWTFNHQRVSKNAHIIIQKIKGEGDIFLMIQNKNQFTVLSSSKYFICNGSIPLFNHISTHYVNTSILPQSFPINPNMGGGIFYFTLFNCLSSISVKRITFSFLNTWGRLPFEKYPLIYICWIESAFYIVLFILCLINSAKHTELRVTLHYLILGTVFIYTLSIIITSVLFTYANSRSDKGVDINQNIISILSSVLLCLRNFCLLALILFLVSGLSIVYEKISTSRVIMIISISAVFSVAEFLCDSYVSDNFSFGIYSLIYVIFIILYILYGALLLYLAYHSLNTLEAHLSLIYTANIDPNTTPTFRKLELLDRCRKCSIAILLFFVGSSMLYRMGVFYYFISYLIIEIAMSILISIVCWYCRLRYKMAATYCDDEEAYIVNETHNRSQNDQDTDDQLDTVPTVFQYNNDNNSNNKKHRNSKSPRNSRSQNQSQINNNDQQNNQSNDQSTDQTNLQQETGNTVSVLTNPYDLKNNINDIEDDRSLSSSLSTKSDSEISFESDVNNQSTNNNQNQNENSTQNERSNNSLKKWEYGMLLPPMPNEDFSQNQIHPTD